MTDRSDVIEQILSVKSRLRPFHPRYEMGSRISNIRMSLKESKELHTELLRHYPVALVATIESYFRIATANLIDAGTPWLDNAANLISKERIKFETVKSFQGKLITIGDYVGATISISNLASLNNIMTTILNRDFLKVLAAVHDRWAAQGMTTQPPPIITNADATYECVEKIFQLRHILCHEFASLEKITREEIEQAVHHVDQFLRASEQLVADTIFPNAPLNQTEMNLYTFKQAEESKAKLQEVEKQLLDVLDDKEKAHYQKIQGIWDALRSESVAFVGNQYVGGSIRPMKHNLESKNLTDERIPQVQRLFEEFKPH